MNDNDMWDEVVPKVTYPYKGYQAKAETDGRLTLEIEQERLLGDMKTERKILRIINKYTAEECLKVIEKLADDLVQNIKDEPAYKSLVSELQATKKGND